MQRAKFNRSHARSSNGTPLRVLNDRTKQAFGFAFGSGIGYSSGAAALPGFREEGFREEGFRWTLHGM